MMVVIAVVGALLAIAAPMWMTNSSAEVNSSTYRLSALFDEARTQAVSLGEPVRILINDDEESPGQYRRYVIAVQWVEEKSEPGYWKQVLNPLLIGEGVYFDFDTLGVSTQVMPFAMGGLMGAEPRIWRFYEIEGNGSPANSIERNVVLGAGNFNEFTMTLKFPNQDVVGGFRISDTSRLVYFRSAEDVEESIAGGGR